MSTNGDQTGRILADPAFHAAARRRSRFARTLAALMCFFYFGFIALVAFAPTALGGPMDQGYLSIGMALGLMVIVIAFVLTAVYVVRANAKFDQEMRSVVERNQ